MIIGRPMFFRSTMKRSNINRVKQKMKKHQIESVIGPVDLKSSTVAANTPATSPGQQPVHYAPHTTAYRFEAADATRIPPTGVMRLGRDSSVHRHGATVEMPTDPAAYAHSFYATLRELDAMNLPAIYIEIPPDRPEWLAVRDRILRATRPLP